MKLFLDTASISEIKEYNKHFPLRGVTTNPSLIAKEGVDYGERIQDILDLEPPFESVSFELVSQNPVREADEFLRSAKNLSALTFKLPMTKIGLRACKSLSQAGHKVNMTLIFSLAQAVLAIEAGADYVSPFIGRVDDIGGDGMQLVHQIQEYVDVSAMSCEVIAASARTLDHVTRCAQIGADIVTLPPALLEKMLYNPLTDSGLATFEKDYAEALKCLS